MREVADVTQPCNELPRVFSNKIFQKENTIKMISKIPTHLPSSPAWRAPKLKFKLQQHFGELQKE